MNDADDEDGSKLSSIEDAVGKAVDERSSQVSVHHRRRKRGMSNTLDGVVQRRAKQLAQAAALLLVPPERFEGVFPGFGEKNDATHRSPLVISAYTSSQATPTGPS